MPDSTRINIVSTCLTSVKDMISQTRDNATKGSDQTLTDPQRKEHANRVRLLFIKLLSYNTIANTMACMLLILSLNPS